MVAGQRIVQAWRSAEWAPGPCSIVTFQFAEGDGTPRPMTHDAVTEGAQEPLVGGWSMVFGRAAEGLARRLTRGPPPRGGSIAEEATMSAAAIPP